MASAVLSNEGQTTIPQEVMDRLKLRPGDRVEFVVQENGTAILIPKKTRVSELRGILVARRHLSIDEMDDAIQGRSSTE